MRVSLRLPEAMVDINFGGRDDNNGKGKYHHNHSKWVSIVGCANVASNVSTRPCQLLGGERGCIRPGPGGRQYDDDNVGISIGIGRNSKYYSLYWTRENTSRPMGQYLHLWEIP